MNRARPIVRGTGWRCHQRPDSASPHQARLRGRAENRQRWNGFGTASTAAANPTTTLRLRGLDLCLRHCRSGMPRNGRRTARLRHRRASRPTRAQSAGFANCAPPTVSWCIAATARRWSWSANGRRPRPRGRPSKWRVACVVPVRWRRSTPRCAAASCTRPELWRAAVEQAGRRGIVAVRDLIPLADASRSRRWRAKRGWQ